MNVPWEPILEPSVAYEDDAVLAVRKPSGMHTAPLPRSDGPTLCSWAFERYPELRTVRGRNVIEGGLLHRLDESTSGLVLFARTDEAYASVEASADKGLFRKSYRALCEPCDFGLPGSRPALLAPPGADAAAWVSTLRRCDCAKIAGGVAGAVIRSRFRPFGPGAQRVACARAADLEALPSRKDWTKDEYETRVAEARAEGRLLEADVELHRGFRHQIRAHFAWMGLPLYNDELYGEGGGELALRAYRLEFPRPGSGGSLVIDIGM